MAIVNYQLLTWDGVKQKRVDSESLELKLGKLSIGSIADVEVAMAAEESARIAGDAATLASANSYADSAIAAASSSLSGDINDLQADLAQEILDRAAADTTLQNNIDAEASARAAADTALQGEVDAVEAGLAQELLDRAAAVSAEAAARIAGDAATLASANSYADGKITALVNGAPAVLDTLKELADALASDPNFATTVTTQIAGVQTNLDAEVTRATAAETALQGEIDAEEARALAAEGVLASDIAAEETRALAAEAFIQGQIDVLKLVTKTVSVAVTVGQICYVKSDGSVAPAIATAALHNAQLLVAFESAASGSAKFYVVEGSVIGGFSGLTPGKNQYVSAASAGEVVESLSGFAATNSVYSVGRAISASQISFSPKFEFEY